MTTTLTGLDSLVDSSFAAIKGQKVGVLANQATCDRQLRHIVELLLAQDDCTLSRIFAPEHGFGGVLQDMDRVDDETEGIAQLPIISLYGSDEESLRPEKTLLEDLDTLIVDLPDIGSRYYTFAQTMTYCMQVASGTDCRILVLDRPNPINGSSIEGSGLEPDCRSFCGYSYTPQRNGLTLGEIARLVQAGFGPKGQEVASIDCKLEIVQVHGWRRDEYFDQTGLPWISPSVNMPTLDTAIVYPGACLFEATALSEGRGTTRPFEYVGAPYINGRDWIEAVTREEIHLDGATLRPIQFMPKFQKHANVVCGGVQFHVDDRSKFNSIRWSLALIAAAKRLYPDNFAWRHDAYEFVDKVPAIDLLYGSGLFRKTIETDGSLAEVESDLLQHEAWFAEARKAHLLY